jgi:hypothetical protein
MKAFNIGDRVMTVKTQPTPHDFTSEALATRKWGVTGRIEMEHNSHGLCYRVRHSDNSEGYYTLFELIPEPHPHAVAALIESTFARYQPECQSTPYPRIRVTDDGKPLIEFSGELMIEEACRWIKDMWLVNGLCGLQPFLDPRD